MVIKEDRKELCVSNPRLARIRNEFRKLWYRAFDSRYLELLDEINELYDDWEKRQQVRKNLNDLDEAMKSSTLKCSECGTFSGDRIYVAEDNRWFCIKCYNGPYVPWPDIGDD